MKKILFLLIISTFTSCYIQREYVVVNKEGKGGYYLQDVSRDLKVPIQKVYYFSTEATEPEEYVDPSIVTFVKNNHYVSIDNIQKTDENGMVTSCSLGEINKDLIAANLEPTRAYSNFILKSMLGERKYEFPEDKIVGLLVYTNEIKPMFYRNHLDLLKRLEEQGDIEYIILTVDGKQITDIEDIEKTDLMTNTLTD